MNKSQIIERQLAFEKFLLGMDYSKTYRYRPYKKGSGDCSSLQAMAMSFAGFPLLSDKGKELLTSCYEVYAEGYELIYPSKESDIGKKLPSASNLCTTYGAQPGDLVFFNFDSSTSRANKITHIATVLDESHYIHTANNREKLCIVPITWGRSRICAIIRLKDNVQSLATQVLQKGSKEKLAVKRLQAILNFEVGSTLTWDGAFGSKTEAALKEYQRKVGLPVTGICGEAEWNKMLDKEEPIIPKPSEPKKPTLRIGDKGDEVEMLQQRLVDLKYTSVGKVDGSFGPKTDGAVREFQKDNKLTVDGVVGSKTWAALETAQPKTTTTYAFTLKRVLKRGVEDGNDIKDVQKRLIVLGYKLPKYGADGDFGAETEAAVEAFQKAKKLTTDGVVGPKTCVALGGKWEG